MITAEMFKTNPAGIGCRKCYVYSTSKGRCGEGKVNFKTKKAAAEAANFMGIGYVCPKGKVVPDRDKIQELTSKKED